MALQAEIDREQQELLSLVEEQHGAWRQKLRLSFARLRVLSKQAILHEIGDSESNASLKETGAPCTHGPRPAVAGHITAQPLAAGIDPLPLRVDEEIIEHSIRESPTWSLDRSLSPKSAIAVPVAEPSGSQSGKVIAPAMSSVDFRLTERTISVNGVALLRQRVKLYIDYVAGVFVLLNTILMLVELEWEGRASGYHIGMSPPLPFEHAEPIFRVLDSMFVYIYLAELVLRMWITWPEFHRSCSNWFDAVLVTSGLASQL